MLMMHRKHLVVLHSPVPAFWFFSDSISWSVLSLYFESFNLCRTLEASTSLRSTPMAVPHSVTTVDLFCMDLYTKGWNVTVSTILNIFFAEGVSRISGYLRLFYVNVHIWSNHLINYCNIICYYYFQDIIFIKSIWNQGTPALGKCLCVHSLWYERP